MLLNISIQTGYHTFIMNNILTIEDINTLRVNINKLENWKGSIFVICLILDSSILKTKDLMHGMDEETT